MTMTSPQVATALSSLISLTLLWVLYYWGWAPYRVDKFRNAIFVLRGELFDIARNGEMAFDDPAYTHLRKTLNGFLRFADRLSYLNLFLAVLTTKRHPELGARLVAVNETWIRVSSELDPAIQAKLRQIRAEMHFAVLEQVLFSSPLVTLTAVPMVILLVARNGCGKLIAAATSKVRQFAINLAHAYIFRPLDALAFVEAEYPDSARHETPTSLTYA